MDRLPMERINISIHAPREGGDVAVPSVIVVAGRFQSTPPARGATCILSCGRFMLPFQSTPPARGATDNQPPPFCLFFISIHAPREGGDLVYGVGAVIHVQFQSTPPARGATGLCPHRLQHIIISIHAPARGATACP